MRKRKTPTLRFRGFNNDWEQRKLGDIAKIVMGQSPSSKNYTKNPEDYILVQGNADIRNGKVVPRVWTTQITKIAHKGDIILTVRAPVGEVAITDYTIVLGRGVASIKGNKFILQLLIKMNRNSFWNKLSTGSTFESINSNDIKKTIIFIPSIKEQNKIGNLLNLTDKLLTLQERKYEELKLLKKALLQNMFAHKIPYPKLRFKNFNSKWKQQKLGNIAQILSGGTPSTKISKYWNGDINWYSPTEIGTTIFINQSKKKITEEGLKHSSAKLLPKGKTILFTSRAKIGEMAILTSSGTTNQGFQSWVIDSSQIDIYFLFSLGKTLKHQAIRLAYGSTFLEISNKNVKNLKLRIPCTNEQKILGSFLKIIDSEIYLQKKIFNKLEKMKKFLLQNMFI